MSENRTNEFFSIAKAVPTTATTTRTASSISSKPLLEQQQQKQQNGTAAANNKKNFTELRTFHTQAAGISKDIATTSALIKQLTDIVKHKSILFQDQDTIQINQLVVRIKQSIENLNTRLDIAAKTSIEQQKRLYGKNSQISEASNNLISELQNEFAVTASNFKTILQQRTDSLTNSTSSNKSDNSNNNDNTMDEIPDMTSHLQTPPPIFGSTYGNDNRTLQHSNSTPSAMFPTLDLTSTLVSLSNDENNIRTSTANSSTSLPRPHGITSSSGGSTALYQRSSSTPDGYYNNPNNMYGNISLLTPLDIQRMEDENATSGNNGEQQQMLQFLPTEQSNYLATRAEAMSAVETNIVELGTIFNKLAGLVNEHKELVQRVEDNVEEANTNVLLSMDVLTDTLHSLRTNKMLALKLFSILVTFIILFIIFFA